MANRHFNRMKDEGRKGRGLYIIGALKALMQYKSKRFKIMIDGKEFFDDYMFSATIGIGPYNGGGMLPMPAAVFDDGLFDITVIKKLRKFSIFRGFNKLYNGQIYSHPKVLATQGKSISIESNPESPVEIDGEALGFSPFTFEIIPRSISVVIGENFFKANELVKIESS
jgi:diacylglycerol kinase family enzyme